MHDYELHQAELFISFFSLCFLYFVWSPAELSEALYTNVDFNRDDRAGIVKVRACNTYIDEGLVEAVEA